MKACTKCGEVKPLEDFPADSSRTAGYQSECKVCKASAARDRRAQTPREVQNARMQAYKAGMRKDKCALCASEIQGLGICESCMSAIKALGDSPEALKKAAKALKWVQEQ